MSFKSFFFSTFNIILQLNSHILKLRISHWNSSVFWNIKWEIKSEFLKNRFNMSNMSIIQLKLWIFAVQELEPPCFQHWRSSAWTRTTSPRSVSVFPVFFSPAQTQTQRSDGKKGKNHSNIRITAKKRSLIRCWFDGV